MFRLICTTFAAMIEEKDKDIEYWYVVGTRGVHQEIRVRDDLRQAGIESYVPLVYELKKTKGHQTRKMVPAITGMVFALVSYNHFMDFAMSSSDKIYLQKSAFSNNKNYLRVSRADMERFMAVTTSFSDDISYFKPEEVTLHEGELVELQLGSTTYQAEIKRIKGKRGKQLVVEIPGVTAAVLKLTPELMKTIKRLGNDNLESERQHQEIVRQKKIKESGRLDLRRIHNLELDKKEVTKTARHLLFEVAEGHLEDPENKLARIELLRLNERIKGVKGVIAEQEGELALATYLAAHALGDDTTLSEDRLRKAIDHLKDTSILKLRLRYYLARLTEDAPTLKAIQKETKTWNKLRLTARQKTFWEEYCATSQEQQG